MVKILAPPLDTTNGAMTHILVSSVEVGGMNG